MGTRILYNVLLKSKGSSTLVEHLFVLRLAKAGEVYNVPCDSMKRKVTSDGKIEEQGEPLQVTLEEGEFLLTVVRIRTNRRRNGTVVKAYISPDDGHQPMAVFAGSFGNPDGSGRDDFWRFPMQSAISTLSEISTAGQG